jgi:hypothetical protein
MPLKPASSRGRGRRLIGRATDCRKLDSLLEALRRGESYSLVIRGEAGVGKTALPGYLTEQAADCRVISVTAVQSEMELAFAALHQLCAPLLGELEALRAPERDALGITFGLREGPVPDRFLVGPAVLSVLAVAAEQRPLVCVVDDEQSRWAVTDANPLFPAQRSRVSIHQPGEHRAGATQSSGGENGTPRTSPEPSANPEQPK